ncbi:MAG: DUF3558 domain-containing protein [Rhodococcus sp.]|nr:DUF3558 domain-containing protein [Rhodococcus sp. (in: high G+C Gram-positive bacteria)]
MTRIRLAAGVVTLMVGVAFGVTACGDNENSDTPTTTAEAQPWDPCTLSDEALRAATLDPVPSGTGAEGPGQPGWKGCEWKGEDFAVIVNSSATATVDQFRNGYGNTDFRDVMVAGREGFTYRDDRDEPGTFCWLVVPFESGGVMNMQVDRSPFTKDETSTCEWAMQVGDALVAEMPR